MTSHGCMTMTLKPMEASRRAKTEKSTKSSVKYVLKVSLTVFFDYNSMVHFELLPQVRTVNN